MKQCRKTGLSPEFNEISGLTWWSKSSLRSVILFTGCIRTFHPKNNTQGVPKKMAEFQFEITSEIFGLENQIK